MLCLCFLATNKRSNYLPHSKYFEMHFRLKSVESDESLHRELQPTGSEVVMSRWQEDLLYFFGILTSTEVQLNHPASWTEQLLDS